MERVTFLLEESGERLSCLLNPASMLAQRTAGIRPRRSLGGSLAGMNLTDDPLLYTGGGSTEWQLDLLFDVAVAGSTIQTEDVRDLTAPLWALAENALDETTGRSRPPMVRFLWGKTWNVPGVVTAVAERFEHFAESGAPRRSWLRLRLRRVNELTPAPSPRAAVTDDALAGPRLPGATDDLLSPEVPVDVPATA